MLLIAPLLCSAALAAPDYGPLMARTQAPLQSGSLSPRFQDASHAGARDREFHASATVASVWADDPEYQLDYYQNDVSLGYSRPLWQGWRIEASFLHRFVGNNRLDSLTKAFHDTFGLSQNGRDEVGKHQSTISVPDAGIDFRHFNGKTLDNVYQLYLEQSLYQGQRSALSWGLSLHLNEVSSGPFEKSSFEQGVQLNYQRRYGDKHRLYGLAAVVHKSDTDLAGIALRDWTWNAGIGYQYQSSHNHAWLAEYQVHKGEAVDLGQLSELVHEFMLGYRYHMAKGAIEFVVIENLVNHDNSTDIAFTLGYRRRF
ncbi:DUF3187 family protein [Gallaecimonas sp. GXIMD4217]|uniref:DUF3187 family protein n=1 Tax=Gallaecimonas sp. GXIMD4217 TaxID=3131927 RepID=UPI00311B3498